MVEVNSSGLGIKTAKFRYDVNGSIVTHLFDYFRESYGSMDVLSTRKKSDVARQFVRHKCEIAKAIARL